MNTWLRIALCSGFLLATGCGQTSPTVPTISASPDAAGTSVAQTATNTPSVVQSRAPEPTAASPSDYSLAQLITKVGHYEAGVDIEPGQWTAFAWAGLCRYRTFRGGVQTTWDKALNPIGTDPDWGVRDPVSGALLGPSGTLWMKTGDAIEIFGDNPLDNPDAEPCQFWNEDLPGKAVPQNSDVPWRNVERNTSSKSIDEWKLGQFDYLDAVKQRISGFDERQLTAIGLWTCKLKESRFTQSEVKNAAMKFARLDDIQADFLTNTSYRYMCP